MRLEVPGGCLAVCRECVVAVVGLENSGAAVICFQEEPKGIVLQSYPPELAAQLTAKLGAEN